MCHSVTRITAASIVLLALVGCIVYPPPPISLAPGDIPAIQLGITPEELADRLEGSTCWQFEARHAPHHRSIYRTRAKYERLLTHQFTISNDDSGQLLCVRSRVIWPAFLFLFSDRQLTKIYQSNGLATAGDPEEAAQQILETEPVAPDQFASSIQRAVERENWVRRAYEPPPIPEVLWHLSEAQTLRERSLLLDRYDGLKLHLDMSAPEVIAVFGEPHSTLVRSSDEIVWVYRAQPKRTSRQIVVSIVFQNGRIRAIYSQEFWQFQNPDI